MLKWFKKTDENKSLKKSDEKIPSPSVSSSGKKNMAIFFLTTIIASIKIDTIKKIFDFDIDINIIINIIQNTI